MPELLINAIFIIVSIIFSAVFVGVGAKNVNFGFAVFFALIVIVLSFK